MHQTNNYYYYRYILYCILLAASDGQSNNNYEQVGQKLSNFLSSNFLNITRFEIIEKNFVSKMGGNINFQQISPDVVLDKVQKDIMEYLNGIMQSLKNIVVVAEESAKDFDYLSTNSPFEVENYTYNDLRDFQMDDMDSDSWVMTSGVHKPLDVFIGDKSVIRDIDWTNNENLLQQFVQNTQGKSTILRQYIATHAGITRIYPASQWKLEPSLMTVDLFDPRYRHWFISAITCPKDVLFLLDYSGSVLGQTLRLIKLTVMTILASLTADDYINAIWFNKDANIVMKECFDGFVPATTKNKILLQNKLELIEPHFEANFSSGLKFAYSAFMNLTNYTEFLHDINYGSGCHKMLLVMTDSTEDHTEEMFNKLKLRNEDGTLNVSVRFFGIAMGFGTTDIKLLQEMSCLDKGFYTKIDSVEDIKLQSRMFFPVLSRPLALTFSNMSAFIRPVTWTGPYMDAQGVGPVLTASMPIVNTMSNGSEQEFLGVAAIDIKLSELQSFIQTNDLGPEAYFFITDGNGHLIYHPRRRIPEIDLQMIRRSACFDASANKSGDATVLFTDANEETYAQMGYYETLPHLDMLELEFPTEETEKFRQIMVSQTCSQNTDVTDSNSVVLLSENFAEKRAVLYKCRQIANTSFSIAIASPTNSPYGARINDVDVSDISLIEHPLVWWSSAPRVHCGIDFGAISILKRALIFNQTWHTSCNNMNDFTKRLLLDFEALSPWVANLPEITVNSSCDEMFATEIFQLVFIQTDGGLTVTYPRCSKYFPDFLKLDTWNSDQYAVAKQSPNQLTITLSTVPGFINLMKMVYLESFPLAVVGAVLPSNYISDYLRNFTELSECWPKEGPITKWCHLINRDLIVVHSNVEFFNTKGNRLGNVDPKLFEHMVNQSLVSHISFKDYQAKCPSVGEGSTSVSDGNSITQPFGRWLVHIFGSLTWFMDKTLWLQFWTFFMNLFVPTKARLKNCDLVFPKKEQNCILERHFYTFDLAKLPLEDEIDDTCIRKFNLFSIPNTNLFLAIVDKPCDCNRHCSTSLPINPVRSVDESIIDLSQVFCLVSECEEIKLKYRNRKFEYCTPFHTMENTTKCSKANKLNNNFSIFNFVALIVFYMYVKYY